MLRRLLVLTLAAAALPVMGLVRADETPAFKTGNWIVAVDNPTMESRLALLKIEEKDGKLKAEDLPTPSSFYKVESIAVKGREVAVVFKLRTTALKFEGMLNPDDPKTILGTFGDGDRFSPASLRFTDLDKLESKDMQVIVKQSDEMKAFHSARSAPLLIQLKLRQAKDDEAKAALKKQLDEARKISEEKLPALSRAVIDRDPKGGEAYHVAGQLIGSLEKDKAGPEQAAGYVKIVESYAASYGPRFASNAIVGLAESLSTQKGFEKLAIAEADKAVAGMPKDAPASTEVRVLKALKRAQTGAGLGHLVKETEAKLAKLETKLDEEYLAKVPPFKPEPFAGRKDKGNRVAVLELFTGAQCPPCVAADVAFDALGKAYKPKDLILIQYHMHIPGPDPLTNPDTVARWDYYRKLFPEAIRGTPSTLFNGKSAAAGGGGMANSENKFDQYRKLIDAVLEEETDVQIAGGAKLKGDTLAVEAVVKGSKSPDENQVLRFLLLEETIHYVGGNGLRYHHDVLRAMPGGPAGVKLKDLKEGRHAATLELPDLKKRLTKYLDDYAADERPFPNDDRPLDFKHLRVVAIVQDDETGAISQAVQFEVEK